MRYVDYLKKYDNYDKYILYLLALGMNIVETAKAAEVTRETVYQVIKRNQEIIQDSASGLSDALRQAEKEPDSDADIQAESSDKGQQARTQPED